MPDPTTAIRGTFFDFWTTRGSTPAANTEAARFVRDGLLVVEDGMIADFGRSPRSPSGIPASRLPTCRDRLILPGFIDGHIHFPQVRVLGAYGNQLLDWLQNWIFPEEVKYADRDYARDRPPGISSMPCSPAAPRPARRSRPAARSRPRSSSTRPTAAACA